MSSLIRGGANPEDVGHISRLAQLQCMRLNCNVWCEWVDSDSHPADGLSRAGLFDEWTRKQDWELFEYKDRDGAKTWHSFRW